MGGKRVGMLAGCMALALLSAGCGGSGSIAAWQQPDFAARRAAQKADDDLELAKHAVLTANDMPGYGIRQYRSSSDDPLPPISKQQFAKCMHVKVGLFDSDKPRPGIEPAHSSRFSINPLHVSTEVQIFRTKKDADAVYAQLFKTGIEGCLGQLFREAALTTDLPRGAQIGQPTFTRAPLAIGQRATVYVFSLPIASTAGSQTVVFELIYAQQDRALLSFDSSNIGTAFPLATAVVLTRRMVSRLGSGAR